MSVFASFSLSTRKHVFYVCFVWPVFWKHTKFCCKWVYMSPKFLITGICSLECIIALSFWIIFLHLTCNSAVEANRCETLSLLPLEPLQLYWVIRISRFLSAFQTITASLLLLCLFFFLFFSFLFFSFQILERLCICSVFPQVEFVFSVTECMWSWKNIRLSVQVVRHTVFFLEPNL
jgi:hypothetical protein